MFALKIIPLFAAVIGLVVTQSSLCAAKLAPASNWFSDPVIARLARAAGDGNIKLVEELVKSGVDINFAGKDGCTPLAHALLRQNKRGFKRLLELGANPNQGGVTLFSGGHIMTMAAQADDPYFLDVAIEHGGDVNIRGSKGNATPLFHALLTKRMKNIELLVKWGADLNLTSDTRLTPFLFALRNGNYKAAMFLLKNGSDWRVPVVLGGQWENGVNTTGTKVIGAVRYLTIYSQSKGPNKESEEWRLRGEMIRMLHSEGAEFEQDVLVSAGITEAGK